MEEHEKTMILNGRIDVPYNYNTGKVVGKFYDELEENHRLLGIKCPKCKTVYFPPRQTCGQCFENMEEWVEVESKGIVTNFTVVHYSEPSYQPVEAPFAQALIKLNGSDTPFVHLLGETDFDKIDIGMRVKAVFSDEKTGNILNIKYFKPE